MKSEENGGRPWIADLTDKPLRRLQLPGGRGCDLSHQCGSREPAGQSLLSKFVQIFRLTAEKMPLLGLHSVKRTCAGDLCVEACRNLIDAS